MSHAAGDIETPEQLAERALVLLLRSPRLSVSTALELLDIGDRDFRRMLKTNARLADVIAARERGDAPLTRTERPTIRKCAACGGEYIPYAGARWCSDECATVLRTRKRQPNRPTPDA